MPQRASLRDALALAKPRLSLMVICTAGAGMALAPRGLPWPRALLILLATAWVVGAANALNCYLERDTDRRMQRTRRRPLPAGRLSAPQVLWGALAVAALSMTTLFWVANPLTALLSFVALAVYACIYTPMKRVSAWALVVGALPGALPPLMGYTACTNAIGGPGLMLFALLFIWQVPHFLAIAVHLRDDYARAGLRVLPHVVSHRAVVGWATLAALGVWAVSLWPVWAGWTSLPYRLSAHALGSWAAGWAASGLWQGPGRWARGLFLTSLVHLMGLLVLLIMGMRA